MAKRPKLIWLFWLVVAAFAGCSFDSRTLHVTPGIGGSAAGETASGGSAVSAAGKATAGGSIGSGGDVTTEGGAAGLAGGEKCTADSDCASNSCLDGICCAAACDGACKSCAKAVTGKTDGACEGVTSGTDPHDDCAQGKAVCGLDGQCDGSGACRFAPPSTMCGAESCANDKYTPPAACDGAGECGTPAAVSCSGHPCVDTRCDIPCMLSTDCPNGLFCDNKVCAPQKTNGTDCGVADECSSTFCSAEKVCCDKPCDLACYSCKQTSTGQTDGKCSFVQAGAKHGTDCPGNATCNGAGTGVTPAPTCNGAGACAAAGDAACGAYACNTANASCKTQCSTATDCAKNDYCAGNVCKPKVTDGGLCTSNAQCASTLCGGRCCASQPCDCPQPSAGNVIKNPGFDKDLTSWNVEMGTTVINWQPGTFMTGNMTYADGHTCAYSGAAYISNPDPNNNSQRIWQCAAISTQTDYNFAVQQATLSGAYTHCVLDLYAGPGCTGGFNTAADSEWINVGWSTNMYPTLVNSSFAVSAKVSCYVEPNGSFFVDNVYLTPAPGQY
jgi:hypothetical protein